MIKVSIRTATTIAFVYLIIARVCHAERLIFGVAEENALRVINRVLQTTNGAHIANVTTSLRAQLVVLLRGSTTYSSVQDLRARATDEELLELTLHASVGRAVVTEDAARRLEYDITDARFVLNENDRVTRTETMQIMTIILFVISARLWHLNQELSAKAGTNARDVAWFSDMVRAAPEQRQR